MSTYQVWYMRPEWVAEGIAGRLPDKANLAATHVMLTQCIGSNLNDVYASMQGAMWSPNGEAAPLIRAKGLTHTSMSIGDIIVNEHGIVHVVAQLGFVVLTRAVGFAVIDQLGEINMRTVSPTEQAAMVNWLGVEAGVMVPQGASFDQIRSEFEQLRGKHELVAVEVQPY